MRLATLCLAVMTVANALAADGRYAIPTTGQEAQRFIPDKLVDIALLRASEFHGKEHSWYLYTYLDAYRDYLLVGGKAGGKGTLDVRRRAFLQGIADARTGATSATPEDFGYERAKLEGRFVIEFEGSRFHPSGSDDRNSALAFRTGRDISPDEIVEGQNYVVECWLSPEGTPPFGWGHMGMYKRQIVVLGLSLAPRGSKVRSAS